MSRHTLSPHGVERIRDAQHRRRRSRASSGILGLGGLRLLPEEILEQIAYRLAATHPRAFCQLVQTCTTLRERLVCFREWVDALRWRAELSCNAKIDRALITNDVYANNDPIGQRLCWSVGGVLPTAAISRWRVRLERCPADEYSMSNMFHYIGVSTADGRCGWGLRLHTGELVRRSLDKDARSARQGDITPDDSEEELGDHDDEVAASRRPSLPWDVSQGPPKHGGLLDRFKRPGPVLTTEDGEGVALRGRLERTIVETIWDPLEGTLSFRVRAGLYKDGRLLMYRFARPDFEVQDALEKRLPFGWVDGGAILPAFCGFPQGAPMRPWVSLLEPHQHERMILLYGDDDDDFVEERPASSAAAGSSRSAATPRRSKNRSGKAKGKEKQKPHARQKNGVLVNYDD